MSDAQSGVKNDETIISLIVGCNWSVGWVFGLSALNSFEVWVAQGDIVLVSLRDFQDEKGDIILKYDAQKRSSHSGQI